MAATMPPPCDGAMTAAQPTSADAGRAALAAGGSSPVGRPRTRGAPRRDRSRPRGSGGHRPSRARRPGSRRPAARSRHRDRAVPGRAASGGPGRRRAIRASSWRDRPCHLRLEERPAGHQRAQQVQLGAERDHRRGLGAVTGDQPRRGLRPDRGDGRDGRQLAGDPRQRVGLGRSDRAATPRSRSGAPSRAPAPGRHR